MPSSSNIFHKEIVEILDTLKPKTAFDVGIGMGKYGNYLKKIVPQCVISGCEIDTEYLHMYKDSNSMYVDIMNKSIIDIVDNYEIKSDLIIFGDVLEHLKYSQVFDVLDYFQYRSKYMLLSYPSKLYQGVWENHASERHLCEIRLVDLAAKYDILNYIKKSETHFMMNLCLIKGYLN